ncbi:hypothetical protein ES708_26509 [subsurface metagenome]
MAPKAIFSAEPGRWVARVLNRVFGGDYALTYKLVEKTGFNEDEVRVLLEPEGLLDRVLSLDSAKVRELISDETVAREIRDKVAALKQVVASYPQFWPKKLAEEE